MTRTATQTLIDALTAATTLAAARTALKDADAYSGASRYNREQMVARCVQVAADLQAQLDAADKADKADKADDRARCPMTGRALSSRQLDNHAQLQAAVAAGVATADGVVVDTATWAAHTTDQRLGSYQATSWTDGDGDKAQPATWNSYYMAALRLGLAVTWTGDKGRTGTLTVVALTDDAAQAARDAHVATVAAYKAARAARKAGKAGTVPATVQAARTAPVSSAMVGKLSSVVADATPDADGVVVVDADALAAHGVGAAWARTSNSHLADAAHVKARTLAAVGYTGRTSRGTLTLTPLAADAQAVA